MTFQPIVPLSGFTGWKFLERTLEKQQIAFNNSAPVARATDYFREKIGSIQTAEDLVNDRRLREVALGAFGLDEDINNNAFIQRILEDGTVSEDALSNRLSDKRYAAFATAFGFGNPLPPRTGLTGFADEIIRLYETRQFERAVGEQDNDLRSALNLRTAISEITEKTQNTDAQWFSVLGSPPLRRVFESALGLPSSIARIDVDQQLTAFKDRARATFGTDKLTEIDNLENREQLTRLFLIRTQVAASSSFSSTSIALTLLQSA